MACLFEDTGGISTLSADGTAYPYLRKHHRRICAGLLLIGKLTALLSEIDRTGNVRQYARSRGLSS